MRKFLLKFLILVVVSFFSLAIGGTKAQLHNFETDNCTMFIDGPPSSPNLWKECCVIHDLRYWFGGSNEDLNATDLRLKDCVEKKAGTNWANIIYRGVRAGHYSPIKNKYQWSWGWINKRPRSKLTIEESNLVRSELRKLSYSSDFIENFIKINLDSSK